MLVQENGNIIRSKDIIKEVVGFYKRLLGQNKDHMLVARPEIMKKGLTLDRSQQINLIKPFTIDEVE